MGHVPGERPYAFIAPGPGEWYFLFRQPVAEPPGDARPWTEIYLELAERLGILQDIYKLGNDMWNLGDAYKIDPAKKYTLRDIAERQARTIFGDHFRLEAITKTSASVLRKKTIQEAYPRMFLPSRVPIYLEYLLDHRTDVQAVLDKLGFDWDLSTYSRCRTGFRARRTRTRAGTTSSPPTTRCRRTSSPRRPRTCGSTRWPGRTPTRTTWRCTPRRRRNGASRPATWCASSRNTGSTPAGCG